MLIKQQALVSHLTRGLPGLFILIGQDHFLLNDAAGCIKTTWRQNSDQEGEEHILHINGPADWVLLTNEANSYSLFASALLIDVRYDKKTLDAAAKKFFTDYLKNINPQCLLLIRAPNLPLKLLQGLVNDPSVHVVQATALTSSAMQQWIATQLQKRLIKFEQQIPALIHQYTQGNMLACAQVIEKLELIYDENTSLTVSLVKEQLVDQCDYQLFELSDACLLADSDKAIRLLRHACHSKIEPTLILWLLTQEIRLLIQLMELAKQSIPFTAACSQLKIWSMRGRLYQSALKNRDLVSLLQLLKFCQTIDERIKSSQAGLVWHALEQLALSLCLGKQVGFFG